MVVAAVGIVMGMTVSELMVLTSMIFCEIWAAMYLILTMMMWMWMWMWRCSKKKKALVLDRAVKDPEHERGDEDCHDERLRDVEGIERIKRTSSLVLIDLGGVQEFLSVLGVDYLGPLKKKRMDTSERLSRFVVV